ncbi:MAG: hypothetical protein AAGI03_12185 [Pseudomonadota bacterium]
MVRVCACFLIAVGVGAFAHADTLRDAASNAVECRGLTDPAARLACFDATAGPLEAALGVSKAEAVSPAPDDVSGAETIAPLAAAEPAPAPSVAPTPTPALASVPATTANEPEWAAAPAPPPPRVAAEPERPREAREFTANIVRITRNNVGRHFFYTEDGAVWEQTQIAAIDPPSALPASAEFRRRLTGNPTIRFGHSAKAYRVRRIE